MSGQDGSAVRQGHGSHGAASLAEARSEADRLEKEVAEPGRRSRRLVALASRFEREGKDDALLLLLDRLLPLCTLPDDEADVHLWRGQALKRQGRIEEALEALERGIALPHPSREREDEEVRYRLHFDAANCLFRLGRYEEAEGRCREAIRIEPRLHEAWKGLGAILKARKEVEEAAACLVAASSLLPDDREAAQVLEALLRENPLLPVAIPALGRSLAWLREGGRFPRGSDLTH